MAAERDSKKILSSAEEESRNLGEYLNNSKAENEIISKKRKCKKTSRRKTTKTWLPEGRDGVKVSKTRKTFLQRVMIVKLRTRKARNNKSCASTLRDLGAFDHGFTQKMT